MAGYSARDVATMLEIPVAQVRAYAATGVVVPRRGPRGELRFSFQDLVVLRTAKELVAANIPARRVKATLLRLRAQLPNGRPLAEVRIAADGERVVVQDGGMLWSAESGQALFDFSVGDLAARVSPLARRAAEAAWRQPEALAAADWYELGCELELTSLQEARDAYERALALDPRHADAHVNLGRLLHEEGEARAAERHYRAALAADPRHAIASYDLGVVLEDLGRETEAIAAYERALARDPGNADAHYNLSGLCERNGRRAAALGHLKEYRKLMGSTRGA